MLKSEKKMSNFGNKQTNYSFRGFTASFITIGGLLTSSLPTLAVTDSYDNDYRVCAAQLLSVGVTATISISKLCHGTCDHEICPHV